MIYITGDTHANVDRIEEFCRKMETSKEDIMIILGDAGFNYFCNLADYDLKEKAQSLPVTFFCIHGNHEERPQNLSCYHETEFHGGTVFQQKDFPDLYFAKDGEFYDFGGKTCLALGGAYSVDKNYRLCYGFPWYASEQPDNAEKARILERISAHGWHTDYVFSHTCPYDTRPVHLFLSGLDQSKVDTSMEEWLQEISDRLEFQRWYFGHFHDDWTNGRYEMLFKQIKMLD